MENYRFRDAFVVVQRKEKADRKAISRAGGGESFLSNSYEEEGTSPLQIIKIAKRQIRYQIRNRRIVQILFLLLCRSEIVVANAPLK